MSRVLMALIVLIAGTAAARADNDLDQRAMIEAVNHAVIASQLAGRITGLPFRAGEAFAKGDVLVSIDCSSYKAEQSRVLAKYRSAKRKRDNDKKLARLQSVGSLEVALSRLNVQQVGAELQVARINVERCRTRAPFDGRVVQRFAGLGQSVKAQDKVLEIIGSQLQARIVVPATWLSWLTVGDAVDLRVIETDARIAGRIERLGAHVDPVSHTVSVWAALKPDDRLRPGMTAVAEFPDRPDDARSLEQVQQTMDTLPQAPALSDDIGD